MIAKIKNERLKNQTIVTSSGKFTFNAQGIIPVTRLPKALIAELLALPGFIPLTSKDEPIDKNNEAIKPEETAVTNEESVKEPENA